MEITTRAIQGRFLLRPSRKLNAVIVGILHRAAAMYGMVIHAFFVASNHYHLIVSIPDVRALALFMNFVNGNTAREAGQLHDWHDKFWSRRYTAIEIIDEAAQIDRLDYLLSNGCKEGLVADPREWPGATCVHSLLDGTSVSGIWIDRTAMWAALRAGEDCSEERFTEQVELELTPLPCWAEIDEDERRAKVASMVDDIVDRTREVNRALGRRPLGAKKILAQNPHDHPESPKKGPAPRCHASTIERWQEFVDDYRAFVHEYHEASRLLLDGAIGAVFPPNCLLPPLAYRRLPGPPQAPT